MVSKIYVHAETAWKFADADQTPDVQISLESLNAGAGRVSARKDLGSGARAEWYEWRATFQFEAAPVVGEAVELYIATSDGSDEDGQQGTTDVFLDSVNSLKNMKRIGTVRVTSATADHDMTASGRFHCAARYFSLCVYNNASQELSADTTVNTVMITPVPPEGQ